MRSGKPTSRSGTTLIEVMLGIIIISILAVLVVTALFYPTRRVVADARRQVALQAANFLMEQVPRLPYGSIPNTNLTVTALNQDLTIRRTVDESVAGEKEILVEALDADGTVIVWLVTIRPEP